MSHRLVSKQKKKKKKGPVFADKLRSQEIKKTGTNKVRDVVLLIIKKNILP